jgi:hypothetical protein
MYKPGGKLMFFDVLGHPGPLEIRIKDKWFQLLRPEQAIAL